MPRLSPDGCPPFPQPFDRAENFENYRGDTGAGVRPADITWTATCGLMLAWSIGRKTAGARSLGSDSNATAQTEKAVA